MKFKKILPVFCVLLSACSATQLSMSPLTEEPGISDYSVSGEALKNLPPAKEKIVVSVYKFDDQTGQHKPNDGIAEYSRAVTQGGVSILTKALLDAGNSGWFTAIERNGLDNLLQERKIIRAMRESYTLPDGSNLPDIPPMLYAGMLIEGGITSYESNVLTGGVGARYLGIGGSTEYRRDIVTVYLRAINVSNGEILLSTNASKTIFSAQLQGGVFKFIGIDELLEAEGGVSVNEPPQFAVRQAIELGVYSLIMEGAIKNIWEFQDAAAGAKFIAQYQSMKGGKQKELAKALPSPPIPPAPHNPRELPQCKTPDYTPTQTTSLATLLADQYLQEQRKKSLVNILSTTPKQPTTLRTPVPELRKVPGQIPPQAKSVNGREPAIRQPDNAGAPGARLRRDLYCDQEGCFPIPQK